MDTDKINAQNLTHLKKLLQGQGKLSLFYHLAAGTDLGAAQVVTTLAARDKKGTKAFTLGKRMKAELASSAKWSFGNIELEGRKFVLHVRRGQLSPARVRKAIRAYGTAIGFGPLTKATAVAFTAAGETADWADEAPTVDDIADETDEGGPTADALFEQAMRALADDDKLSDDDLAALYRDQGALSAMNDALADLFATDDGTPFAFHMATLHEAVIRERLDAIAAASTDDKPAARQALAQLAYIGDDLPGPPAPLSSEQAALMASALAASVTMLDDQLSALLRVVTALEQETARAAQSGGLAERTRDVHRQLDQHLAHLDSLEHQRSRLVDTISR